MTYHFLRNASRCLLTGCSPISSPLYHDFACSPAFTGESIRWGERSSHPILTTFTDFALRCIATYRLTVTTYALSTIAHDARCCTGLSPVIVQRSPDAMVQQRDEYDALVLSYRHLSDLPRAGDALHALKKIASLVKPIMRARGWKVRELCEFYPSQENLLGTYL